MINKITLFIAGDFQYSFAVLPRDDAHRLRKWQSCDKLHFIDALSEYVIAI